MDRATRRMPTTEDGLEAMLTCSIEAVLEVETVLTLLVAWAMVVAPEAVCSVT